MPGLDVEHEWIGAGGLRTHVALAGDPEAPPLLCVHGWPQHWLVWRELIAPLADPGQGGFRVICPDLRGFGWTACPGRGHDPRTFAEDLLALLDAMEIPRASLLAHDWGGMAGWFLGCRHPDRVERMIALNIPTPWLRVTPRGLLSLWRFWYQVAAATPGVRAAIYRGLERDTPARRAGLGGADWPDDVAESFAAQFREPERRRAASALYRHALFRLEPAIALGRFSDLRLRTPTRLIWGTSDFALPETLLEGSDRQADDLEVVRVPGCGHFIAEERPDVVLEHALEFLAARSGG